MFKTFINIFRVPELRNKVIFTLFLLAIYRIGYHVPLPGVDQEAFLPKEERVLRDAERNVDDVRKQLSQTADPESRTVLQQALENAQEKLDRARREYAESRSRGEDTAAKRLAGYVSLFSGGNLSQSTIFGLGVMPYISASIIFQLLTTVVPSLEKLQKEGETGRKKIQEWTRYATVPLALIQAVVWMGYMHNPGGGQSSLVQPYFANAMDTWFWAVGLISLTAGCVFLMWLGEQIDEYGLGNGVSLIILAGIVARMPDAISRLITQTNLSSSVDPTKPMTVGKIIFLVACFVFIIAGSILITQAQRRIPIQQAKHTRGRRVYGGQKQYLPLRVNHGGVMPIIFAQSLMLFPGMFLGWLAGLLRANNVRGFWSIFVEFVNSQFLRGGYLYIVTEVAMIYFFAYFWTTVQFQPKEMAKQLQDYGSFIPGLRPGKRTSDYLEKVMQRITYVGAAFLCILAVVPTAVSAWLNIDPSITQFLGGTGLLIVVSVALDMVQRIEANLLMRDYGGFLSGPGQKGKRIKGRQY